MSVNINKIKVICIMRFTQHLNFNKNIVIILIIFCSLFTSCSTVLEIITGDYKCAYPNCNERASNNSAYCSYHTPKYIK